MTEGTAMEVSGMEGAPSMLIFAAITAHQETAGASNEDRHRCQAFLDSLLALARAGGFSQGDVLCTILARGKVSDRVVRMAAAAVDAAATSLAASALESILADDSGGAHD